MGKLRDQMLVDLQLSGSQAEDAKGIPAGS
jgi:hypothetical protein